MAQVYVSIGSNVDREHNIRAGVFDLTAYFGDLALSSVYESEAVGFSGDNFYNLVAGFCTALKPRQVADILHAIEDAHGRRRDGPRYSSRTLDIDLLLYDDLELHEGKLDIPRDEITRHAFVLWPLAEIAPERRHPQAGLSYRQLWERFDRQAQPLYPIEFAF